MRRDVPEYVKDLAGKLRKNQTEAEKLLWTYLRRKGIKGYRFRRQYPIGRYIADFYCREANLIIEVDGKIHRMLEQKEYDKIREIDIESRNITIIRFTNEEIFNDLDSVISKIIKSVSSVRIAYKESKFFPINRGGKIDRGLKT